MLRRLGLLAAAPFAAVALYLLAALAGAMLPGAHARHDPGEGPQVAVGLIAGPIHYDLLLPLTPELRARLGFAAAAGVPVDHPGAEWLILGWGSRAFYTSAGTYADIAPAAVWTAATGDSAVIRLDVAGPIPAGAPGVEWLSLPPAQAARLTGALLAEIASPEPLAGMGFTGTDAFFPARGRFHIWRTCNAWLGEQLRAAGLPLGRWTPTTLSLRLSLRRFGLIGPSAPGRAIPP